MQARSALFDLYGDYLRPRLQGFRLVEGAYVPLEVRGDEAEHVLAFARVLGDRVVMTIVPRLCLGLLAGAAALAELRDERAHHPSSSGT